MLLMLRPRTDGVEGPMARASGELNKGVVLIKKYSNRRLYDTDESRYVTLEELSARIRSGVDVQVVDARSGEDLTQVTLAQIVIEGRGAARLLPTPLLHELVRMGDSALAEFFGSYVGWAMTVYSQMRRQGRAMARLNPLLAPLLNAGQGGLPWAAPWLGAGSGRTAAPPAPEAPEPGVSATTSAGGAAGADVGPAAPATPLPRDELAALRAEIAALRDAVHQRDTTPAGAAAPAGREGS